MSNYPTPAEVQEVFFTAMRAGYAAGAEKTTMAQFPGSKIISYVDGLWLVRDTWFAGKRGHSSGMTTIFYDGHPVWNMAYQGQYSEEAISTLKAALAENYRGKIWLGGRGPATFSRDGFVYSNMTSPDALFTGFRGSEQIASIRGGVVGYHIFHGIYFEP